MVTRSSENVSKRDHFCYSSIFYINKGEKNNHGLTCKVNMKLSKLQLCCAACKIVGWYFFTKVQTKTPRLPPFPNDFFVINILAQDERDSLSYKVIRGCDESLSLWASSPPSPESPSAIYWKGIKSCRDKPPFKKVKHLKRCWGQVVCCLKDAQMDRHTHTHTKNRQKQV